MITETQPFGKLIDAAIADMGLAKEPVAIEAGMHLSTLYRVIEGGRVSKPKAYALIRAVNKLAMFPAVDESTALRAAGYEPSHANIKPDNVVIAGIIEHLAHLPLTTQYDVLEIVKALHRRHAVK